MSPAEAVPEWEQLIAPVETQNLVPITPTATSVVVDLGAKLGAIRCGPVWTAVDSCGHGLEIYGSEGWGLSPNDRCEFSRACQRSLALQGISPRRSDDLSDVWELFLVVALVAIDPGQPIAQLRTEFRHPACA